jgi:hypothetical protein
MPALPNLRCVRRSTPGRIDAAQGTRMVRPRSGRVARRSCVTRVRHFGEDEAMSHLIDILLEPGKVFTALREKPTFVLPLLLMGGLSAAMILVYFSRVDSAWFIDHALAASGKEMSPSELEQTRKMMPSAQVQGYFGAPFAVIGVVVVSLVIALYYMLAAKVTGAAVSFKQGLALTAWCGIPMLIGMLIALVGAFLMSPQTPLESLSLTRVDPLLVQLPPTHDWSSFAKNFDLLQFWSLFLGALGWRTWTRASWLQSIIVVAIPSVVTYGIMALFAIF